MENQYWTVQEVAEIKGWNTETVRRKCRDGSLNAIKTTTSKGGTLWLIPKESVSEPIEVIDTVPLARSVDIDTFSNMLEGLKNEIVADQNRVVVGLIEIIKEQNNSIHSLQKKVEEMEEREANHRQHMYQILSDVNEATQKSNIMLEDLIQTSEKKGILAKLFK